MLQLAQDLREEGVALYALLETLDERDWRRATPFKSWTVHEVIAHLHFFDRLAVVSLREPEEFLRQVEALRGAPPATDRATFAREHPSDLLRLWRDQYMEMCELFEKADPTLRLKWFGPDMGVRMFATARQMETWAHGQDIYDVKRVKRTNTDRIKNITVIGVKTFGWSFVNRGLDVPGDVPYVRLTAPSGATWEWNEPKQHNRVEGLATEFCHVVTQGRNVADTELRVVGETANRWMAIAQCFAGGPADPPRPGERQWD